MRIVIIEDERLTAEALEKMIAGLRPEADILARIGSVEEAVEWLEEHPEPDLIFCDIHLSDGNSFEIFREVEVRCPVIFATAYNQYAIEAFQVNSIDYLLKPLNKKDVAKALKKFETLYRDQGDLPLQNLQNLLQSKAIPPAEKPVYKSRFMARIGDVMKPVPAEDIAYFLVEDGVVVLTTFEGKRYFVNYSLDQLEEQLNPTRFFRANRQLIVQIEAVREVHPYFKGRLLLNLTPEVEGKMVVSSGRAPSFKEWLEV